MARPVIVTRAKTDELVRLIEQLEGCSDYDTAFKAPEKKALASAKDKLKAKSKTLYTSPHSKDGKRALKAVKPSAKAAPAKKVVRKRKAA